MRNLCLNIMDRFLLKRPRPICTISSKEDEEIPLKRTKNSGLGSDEPECSSDINKTSVEQLCESLENLKFGPEVITGQDLKLSYGKLLNETISHNLLQYLEANIEYYSDDLTQVTVFGKRHRIPRKQVAFGNSGIAYKFSGTSIAAKEWDPVVKRLADSMSHLLNVQFNFVLVNRYADGDDCIGEHKDDEKDLDKNAPIASLSVGQNRDFVFRHDSCKLKNCTPLVGESKVELNLANGSLLVMHPPTNSHWYHSLPRRKKCPGLRINMTFRVIDIK